MGDYSYFELRRKSDALVYQFDRIPRADGRISYKRRDADLWIIRHELFGWCAYDDATGEVMGRSWNTLPADQGDHPPEGEWVSKKGAKSYVYDLIYCPTS